MQRPPLFVSRRRAAGLGLVLLLGSSVSAQELDPPAPEEQPTSAPAALPVPAGDDGAAAEDPDGEPASSEPVRWTAEYHDLDAARTLLKELAEGAPESARLAELGTSRGGLSVPMLEFGAPGSTALDERPTVLLLGGLDGVSIVGSEAVLAIAAELLADPATLPPAMTYLAVPWAAPDGLSTWVAGRGGDGRNARPIDDDGDGAVDEDGPDDLDGDGRVLDMLIEDPEGPWTRCVDARFLRAAEAGDAPRYRLLREGRDDDGDGDYNEDGPGGVDLDRHFPVDWRGPWDGAPGGPRPLSEPLARRLADLVLGRRTMAVVALQGNHGWMATPGGAGSDEWPRDEDRGLFEHWTRRFAHHTGRSQAAPITLAEARGEVRSGSAIDWFYASAASFAFELAPWGPSVQGGDEAIDATYGSRPRVHGDLRSDDAQWAAWLDDEHGGIGFVDWAPVTLPSGERGLVGGWAPRTRTNPPTASLERALGGLPEFVRELGAGRPTLEIQLDDPVRDGDLCRLRARLRNAGKLPTGISRPGTFGRDGGVLSLELPPGARLVAGGSERDVPHIPGGGVSADYEWLLVVPEGASISIRAEDDWTEPVRVEVRL